MRARVCLVTTGQPSTNPRLVKEADALTSAGYHVHVIGAHWAEWAHAADARLLATRSWTCEVIDWRRQVRPALFWKTRARHYMARRMASLAADSEWLLTAAVSRIAPELARAAIARPAALYIAHNLGALPAAAAASRHHQARLGFDAEDFHRGQFAPADRTGSTDIVQRVEQRYLPRCDYVTAASPEIAAAYASLRDGHVPRCILNVFPLADRPDGPCPPSDRGPLRLYWFSQTIGPDRGLETVIAAMGRLGDGATELHLRGVWQAGYRDALTQEMRQAGVSPQRVLSHPPADSGEMVRLAAACDVGLAVEPGHTPNNDLAVSNKIFTYLLAGVAIVATETRGQHAVLSRLGGAAQSVPPGDVDGLTCALRRWTADRTALAAARQAAWRLGEMEFNWDREQRKFLDLVAAVTAA